MNKRMLLATIIGVNVLSAGCQQSTNVNSGVELSSTSSSAMSCVPGSQKVQVDQLQIQGKSVGQTGEAVSYKLNTALACDSEQEVVWKNVGGSEQVANSVTTKYSKPGTYIMTAKVVDSSTGVNTLGKLSMKADSGSVQEIALKTTVVSDQVVVIAPQVGVAGQALNFDLGVPADFTLLEAYWTFGDGTPSQYSKDLLQHTYAKAGTYKLKVLVVASPGGERLLTQDIVISEPADEMVCSAAAAITGPTELNVNVPGTLSLYMPACLASYVGAVRWNFGDNTTASGQTVQHAFAAKGTYEVSAKLLKGDTDQVLFDLKHVITVKEAPTTPVDPVVDPGQSSSSLTCKNFGQTRQTQSELYSVSASCGLGGTKEVTYRDTVTEKCQYVGEVLKWVEITRTKEVSNPGQCQSQSCTLADGSVLAHGGVKTSVVTGEVSVAVKCEFGEEGVVDIFNQLSDQKCDNGVLVNSNTQQGSIKTPGSCPTYKWVPTENFSECSADCGGVQARIHVCANDKGVVSASERCKIDAPVEQRACDKNPEAVARQEVSSTTEEGNASQLCPANQIGVVVNTREVVTTKNYACIDHKVQLKSEEVQPGPWKKESYCKDYVAHRCAHDSLSNAEAKGRYEWMLKCQDQLPSVKEFLTEFSGVKAGSSGSATAMGTLNQKVTFSIDSNGRVLYPSFMDRSKNPEKPWIAPKVKNASCAMPETAYVATVCVSSCATPEQVILAEEAANKKLKYVPFVEALTKKYNFVASLQSTQSMKSPLVQKTKVDQWVTELIDSEHDILVFKMKSGRELRLTPNHPVVTAQGLMKPAGDFKVGEELVLLGGVLDPIVSIQPIKHFGKVYNVFVKSSVIEQNILVTNGYLNGSAYFQNEGAKDMNRSLFRKTLTRGAF